MRRNLGILWTAITATALLASAVVPAAATGLTPHRALYDMRLASAKAVSGGVIGASGAMLYRFSETCSAWEVETQVHLRLVYERGEEAETVGTTWVFKATESKDGRRYDFTVDHKRGGQSLEVIEGSALRSADAAARGAAPNEAAGEVVFAEPPDHTISLAKGILFPTRHLIQVLTAAANGDRMFERRMFDGASLDNPYDVSAAIAGPVSETGVEQRNTAETGSGGRLAPRVVRRRSVNGLAKVRAAGIADRPAWRIRMAFYPLGTGMPLGEQAGTEHDDDAPPPAWAAGLPDFEIEVDYRDDGIAERIMQDFGDFALDLEPTKIETLPRPTC